MGITSVFFEGFATVRFCGDSPAHVCTVTYNSFSRAVPFIRSRAPVLQIEPNRPIVHDPLSSENLKDDGRERNDAPSGVMIFQSLQSLYIMYGYSSRYKSMLSLGSSQF
jgi:hypothetical protein